MRPITIWRPMSVPWLRAFPVHLNTNPRPVPRFLVPCVLLAAAVTAGGVGACTPGGGPVSTASKDTAAQPLALGQPATVRGLVVTVVEVKRTARIVPVADGTTGLFPTSVPGVPVMRDGEELLGLHVRYANRGNADAPIEPTDWFVRPEPQGIHLNAGIGAASFGDPLRSTSLPTYVTRDGWLAFVVPSNAPDAVVGYRLISTLGRVGASGGETIGALWHVSR